MLMILKVKESPYDNEPFIEVVLGTRTHIEVKSYRQGYCTIGYTGLMQGGYVNDFKYYMQGDLHEVVETINNAILAYSKGEPCNS